MSKNSDKESKYKELFTLWQYRKEAPISTSYSVLQKYADYIGSIPAIEFMTKDRGTYREHQQATYKVVNFLDEQNFWRAGKALAYGSTTAYWVAICVAEAAYKRFYNNNRYAEIPLKNRTGLHIVVLPTE